MGYETIWRKRGFASIEGGVAYIYELPASGGHRSGKVRMNNIEIY